MKSSPEFAMRCGRVTRQAQVDTPAAPTVSRKHDYIEGEVDMDAAAEAVLRVFGDVKNEDG